MGDVRKGRFESRLTPLAVRRLKKPGLHADGHGLYLQVGESGARSWVMRFSLHGRTREMGLGKTATIPIDIAREAARAARQLVRDGIDPIEQRRAMLDQRAAEAGQRKTFAEAAQAYVRLKKDGWRNAKHAQQWTNTLEVHAYPLIGKRDVSSISKADIIAILEPIAATKPETASRVRQRIRAVLDLAAARDWRRNHNPRLWDEIAQALPIVPKAKRTKHFIACAYADVPTILQQVQDSTATEPVKLLFELTVITAVRSGESRHARWSEIDLASRTWTIPKERMKAHREHRIPLTDRAVEIIKVARKIAPEGDLLFATGKGTSFSDMTLTALLRRLGHDAITVHGFRSAFRDWAGETTAHPRDVIEAALAHQVENKTEAAYFRSDLFEKRRLLMSDWSKHCAGGRT